MNWKPKSIGQRILWFAIGGSFLLGPGLLVSRGPSIVAIACIVLAASVIVYAHASGNPRLVYRKLLWGIKVYLLIVLVLLLYQLYLWMSGTV